MSGRVVRECFGWTNIGMEGPALLFSCSTGIVRCLKFVSCQLDLRIVCIV